jgi:hypothetical protein
MPVDIRAKTLCNLGTVISAEISDDYIQGSGLVKTSGSCVIDGIISPRMGFPVTFQYTKAGVTRTIPRKLRVMSSFADPFRKTTTVELGCMFTYQSDLQEQFDWRALDDPENSDLGEDDVFIPPPISAKTIAQLCLEELGLAHESIPLKSRFTIPEFSFDAPFLQVLGDLLISESYFAYLDINEVVRFAPLDGTDSSAGPSISPSRSIVDVGPIGVGALPAETVIVTFSNTRLVAPEPLTDDLISEKGWEYELSYSDPTEVLLTLTVPGRPRLKPVSSQQYYAFQYWGQPEPDPAFEAPEDDTVAVNWRHVPITITRSKYDHWGRLVKRLRITKRILAEVNSSYLSQYLEAAVAKAESRFEAYEPYRNTTTQDSTDYPIAYTHWGSYVRGVTQDEYNDYRLSNSQYLAARSALTYIYGLGSALDIQYDFERFEYEMDDSRSEVKPEGYDKVVYDYSLQYVSRVAALGSMSLNYFDEDGGSVIGVAKQDTLPDLRKSALKKYSLKDKPKLKRKLKKMGLRDKVSRTRYLATDDEDWLSWDEYIKQSEIEKFSDTIRYEGVRNDYEILDRDLTIMQSLEVEGKVREARRVAKKKEIGYFPVAKTTTTTHRLYGNTSIGQQTLSMEGQQSYWYGTIRKTAPGSVFNALRFVPDSVEVNMKSGREIVVEVRPTSEEMSINALLKDGTLYKMEQKTSATLAMGIIDAEKRIELSLPYAPDDTVYRDGGSWAVRSGDPEPVAIKFGAVQDRLLLGNRFGISLQLTPESLPARPFSPVYVHINGKQVMYRTNGNSWAMDSSGVLAGTDALYWGVTGTI